MHKDFIFAELLKVPRTKEAEQLFDRNYGKDKPDFLMCYLVHHLEPDVWTLAFWDGDKATAAHVRLAFERMRETFYYASKVKFRPELQRPGGGRGRGRARSRRSRTMHSTRPSVISRSTREPPSASCASCAHRRDRSTFAPDEIVILPEPLTDITPVAGIISQSFSTPLSHVNIRAAAWDIPNVGLRDAAKTYAALDGKIVRFEAGATSATVQRGDAEEIEASQKAQQERTAVLVPKANLAATSLATLDTLHAVGRERIRQQDSEPRRDRVREARRRRGAAWLRHSDLVLRRASEGGRHRRARRGAARRPEVPRERGRAEDRAREIRKEIQDAPLAPAFVATSATALEKLPPAGGRCRGADLGVFVRSSTNAEDLRRFSGAGLYDTVRTSRREAVAQAVKKVWASVWNLAAYEERELYRIDHRQVFGAVLVQIGIRRPRPACSSLRTRRIRPTRHVHDQRQERPRHARRRWQEAAGDPALQHLQRSLRIVLAIRRRHDARLSTRRRRARGAEPEEGQPDPTNARVARLADAAQRSEGSSRRTGRSTSSGFFKGEDVFIVQSRPYMGGPANVPRPSP